jgi:hypothetical protein
MIDIFNGYVFIVARGIQGCNPAGNVPRNDPD